MVNGQSLFLSPLRFKTFGDHHHFFELGHVVNLINEKIEFLKVPIEIVTVLLKHNKFPSQIVLQRNYYELFLISIISLKACHDQL
jgi:hypothetical protein